MNFDKQLLENIEYIDSILEKYLPTPDGYQKIIMKIMKYSLMSGGKRVRPMLMKESFDLFHGKGDVVEPFMAAIEMIHTYSLVHDDLPAMDNDDYRRGRKTTHIVYGEDMAILAGDALLNCAFEVALKSLDVAPEKALEIGKALKILAHKAGIRGMIGGQVIDIESAGKEISMDTLESIFKLKTGALFEASMMIGGVLAGANEEQVKALEDIACKVGIAFQIQDDILDVTSSLEVLGKATCSDEKNEKTTYVTLKGLEASKEDVSTISNEAITKLHGFNRRNLFLEELLKALIARKK